MEPANDVLISIRYVSLRKITLFLLTSAKWCESQENFGIPTSCRESRTEEERRCPLAAARSNSSASLPRQADGMLPEEFSRRALRGETQVLGQHPRVANHHSVTTPQHYLPPSHFGRTYRPNRRCSSIIHPFCPLCWVQKKPNGS